MTFICPACGEKFKHQLNIGNHVRYSKCGVTREMLFWAKTRRTERGCLQWTGHIHDDGYGCANAGGKPDRAHRVAWRLKRGPIPPGRCVLHTCDDRTCVEPLHLFLGTKQDNMDDKVAKSRQVRGEDAGRAK